MLFGQGLFTPTWSGARLSREKRPQIDEIVDTAASSCYGFAYVPTKISTTRERLIRRSGQISDFFADGCSCFVLEPHALAGVTKFSGDSESVLHRLTTCPEGSRGCSHSSVPKVSLDLRIFPEPFEAAGEVSLLLVNPLSERGDTSVRVTAEEVSEADENVE